MSADELKPCPFCGSEEVSRSNSVKLDGSPGYKFVECHKCAACGPVCEPDLEDHVGLWQTRHPSPLLEEVWEIAQSIKDICDDNDIGLNEACWDRAEKILSKRPTKDGGA